MPVLMPTDVMSEPVVATALQSLELVLPRQSVLALSRGEAVPQKRLSKVAAVGDGARTMCRIARRRAKAANLLKCLGGFTSMMSKLECCFCVLVVAMPSRCTTSGPPRVTSLQASWLPLMTCCGVVVRSLRSWRRVTRPSHGRSFLPARAALV